MDEYPSIAQPKFYDSIFKADDRFIQWTDFYHTDGMAYTPLPVLRHAEVKLPDSSKKHESDLTKIQGFFASATRLLDTFADEIVDSENRTTKLGQRTLTSLNTLSVLASNDASEVSKMRMKLYTDELGLREDDGREDALIPLAALAERRTHQEVINKTYRKTTKDYGSKSKDGTKKSTPQPSDGKPDKKSDTSTTKEKKSDYQTGRKTDRSYKPQN